MPRMPRLFRRRIGSYMNASKLLLLTAWVGVVLDAGFQITGRFRLTTSSGPQYSMVIGAGAGADFIS